MTFAGFPSADQIATAVVTASRLTGDDPVAVVTGGGAAPVST